MFLQRLDRAGPILLVVEFAPSRANDPKIVGQQPVRVQAVKRRRSMRCARSPVAPNNISVET
jgi:hypothetical protein